MTTTPTISCEPRYNYPAPIAAWQDVVERLRSVAGGNGYKVITLTVIADGNGRPVNWTKPRVTWLEPKGTAEQELELLLIALAEA